MSAPTTTLTEATRVYAEEGLSGLARESLGFGRERLDRYVLDPVRQRRGVRRLRVGGLTATFGVATDSEAGALRFVARHERRMLRRFLAELRPDDVVLDVGANVGAYSCFAGQVCDTVVAAEPFPPNARALVANAALNDLTNVHLLPHALGATTGTAALDHPPDAAPATGRVALTDGTATGTTGVSVVRGDDLVASGSVPQPTVVKVDVEGAEELVLEGLCETLADDRCRLVFCEVHSPARVRAVTGRDGDAATVGAALAALGFVVEVLATRSTETHLLARKVPTASDGTAGYSRSATASAK
jgi:FkbM family methyltransferase